jgi:hypothetical protein
VVQPLGKHSLPSIMKTWKGYSGRETNRLLNRSGPFWQAEYYDHLIRDESDYRHAIRYLWDNPLKIGRDDRPGTWLSAEAVKCVA